VCRSLIDIQSATAEIRRGIKKNKKEINHRVKNIMACRIPKGGHNYSNQVWSETTEMAMVQAVVESR